MLVATKWNNIYVVLNGNNTIQSINIPKGKYTIVANNGVINEGGNGEMEGGEITIDAQTALILHD